MQTILDMLDLPVIFSLMTAAFALIVSIILRRQARADQTICDAFELGGRMSIDPVEVTGSRLLARRIVRLQQLEVLKATPRGMLVPDIDALSQGISGTRRLARIMLIVGLI